MHRILAVVMIALSVAAPARGAVESFTADPAHTFPSFELTHGGDFTITRGFFQKTAGKITLDRVAKTGSIEIVVDTASMTTGHAGRDNIVRATWFKVEQYPQMIYRSANVKFSGDVPSGAEGELLLAGVIKPVTLVITSFKCRPHPVNKKLQCGADGTAAIKRIDFGLNAASSVGDDIKILFQIEAYKD
ncbi:MAG: polyisoprenoid-binding protein [Betaproteobacteria bacterium]|nr:polyisoprenoid-binding protein [Betaproteobacteria bacterium]